MSLGPHAPALALAAALLVSSCGSSAPEPGGASSALPSSPAPTPSDGDGAAVPDLVIPDLTATPKPTTAVTPRSARVYGADAGWPQCPKGMGIPERPTQGQPMPTRAAEFVILGVTNGPSFTPNPCLADQVAWLDERDLLGAAYAVHSFPDDATVARYGDSGPFPTTGRAGALRNTGYAAARFNIATMESAGLRSPVVWVDVEPVRLFAWSSSTVANTAVVQGAVRGYRDAGFRIGFYSTKILWRRIVGDLRTGAPEWRAAGMTSQAEALRRCGADWSFQGGAGVFGQWVEDGRDRNVTCPGAAADLETWFHQY